MKESTNQPINHLVTHLEEDVHLLERPRPLGALQPQGGDGHAPVWVDGCAREPPVVVPKGLQLVRARRRQLYVRRHAACFDFLIEHSHLLISPIDEMC